MSKPKKLLSGVLRRESKPVVDPLDIAVNDIPTTVPKQPRSRWTRAKLQRKYAAIDNVEDRAFQILSDLGLAGQQNQFYESD